MYNDQLLEERLIRDWMYLLEGFCRISQAVHVVFQDPRSSDTNIEASLLVADHLPNLPHPILIRDIPLYVLQSP